MTLFTREHWLRSAITTAMVCTGVVVTMRLAKADPGGATRPFFSFVGTLRNGAGPLTFTFHKPGAPDCSATTAAVTPDPGTGAFTVEVPFGSCPPSYFDGADVTFDVAVGATSVATAQRMNPVPYARYADQVGVGDCPVGYARDGAASPGTVCVRTVTLGGMPVRDELVKVGAGRSAIWVDRYEASVHFAATGIQLGASNTSGGATGPAVETSGLTVSGQRPAGDGPARAYSHPGQPTVNVTWFQANEACRAAGKRLLQREEWFAASSGTVDGAMCNVSSGGARPAAATNGCVSASGAHDMIGNVAEWTGEWYAGNGPTGPVNSALQNWPAEYNMDGTWNVNGAVYTGGGVSLGIPSAALRGGFWGAGPLAGVLALNLFTGPSSRSPDVGFRCVVPG